MATAVFSKPWTLMDIVDGYSVGAAFKHFNMDVNAEYFYFKKSIQILVGLYNVKVYTNPGVAFSVASLSALSIYIISKKQEHVITYTGNVLSITVLACAILHGKNRPHTAAVACFSTAINLLVAYKKLPAPVTKVWSFTPIVMSSITLYATDDIFQKAIAAQVIYDFGKPYFSPSNNNGGG